MNARRLLSVLVLGLMIGLPVIAQVPQQGAAQLPVSRVVLFSSGVGYFQREGQVDGNARIDLQFHTKNINDLLKSLILEDGGGGQISTVNYDSREPIEKTLKSFAIDLTGNPSLGELLGQVRGEHVELQGKPPQLTPITGIVIGVEKQKKPAGKDATVEVELLNLLTDRGLESIALESVERVRFSRPELDKEFRKALEVLALGHDKEKKTVSLNFIGNGKRPVKVGYVTESPIWKTSYRLALDKESKENKAFLQGWAIVENTTDEDWNGVSLGLISGRPISFTMDLYDPLFITRPVVEPELFASLRPQTYEGEVDRLGREVLRDGAKSRGSPRKAAAPAPAGFGGAGGAVGRFGVNAPVNAPEAASGLDLRQGVASAAVATALGEYFQYQIEQPVSLARQKSALLPIVNQAVEASKVSIYNETVQPKYPLHGLRFKNTTGLHLMQGPITIFEGNSYAGDARIGDLQPKETRLVSYAVDLGTEVVPEVKEGASNLVSVKIYKGILHVTHKLRQQKVYAVKDRSEHSRLVLVEHPYQADWKLIGHDEAVERTRDLYRFEVKVEPGQTSKLDVTEEKSQLDQIALTNLDDDGVRVYIRSNALSRKGKEALEEALALKGKLAQTQEAIQAEERALADIGKDQARIRENMKAAPQTSEAYKRYLKKFDDQETEIEKRQAQVAKLRETAEQQRKGYEGFILNLNIG
jgi:hypothetical protein